jgi:hypothetical protein
MQYDDSEIINSDISAKSCTGIMPVILPGMTPEGE